MHLYGSSAMSQVVQDETPSTFPHPLFIQRVCYNIPSLILTSQLKMDGWKMNFLLGRPMFRGYVSFTEDIPMNFMAHESHQKSFTQQKNILLFQAHKQSENGGYSNPLPPTAQKLHKLQQTMDWACLYSVCETCSCEPRKKPSYFPLYWLVNSGILISWFIE